jgi:hypothetical protein
MSQIPSQFGIQVDWSEEAVITIEIRHHPMDMAAKVGCDHFLPNCRQGYEALHALVFEVPMFFVARSGRRVA